MQKGYAVLEINESYYNCMPEVKELIDDAEFEVVLPMCGVMYCSSSEAEGGKFEEVENALIKLGVPFDRCSSESDTYPAVKRIYRPVGKGASKVDSEVELGKDGETRIDCSRTVRVLWSDTSDAEKIKTLKDILMAVSPELKKIEECVVIDSE